MTPLLTAAGRVRCMHGGEVVLRPGQTSVLAQGAPVLCFPDLEGAPIVGCPQPVTPASKPCTVLVQTLPGSTAPKVVVAGRPPYLATLTGTTDGVPPGAVVVASAGQAVVQA